MSQALEKVQVFTAAKRATCKEQPLPNVFRASLEKAEAPEQELEVLRREVARLTASLSEVEQRQPRGRSRERATGAMTRTRSRSRSRCYRCGDASHMSYDCKFLVDVCYTCKKAGHVASECPSKAADPKAEGPSVSTKSVPTV